MALHVDIIKADPLGSSEHRLAQAVYAGGTVTIEATDDPAYWRATLTTVTSIDPDAQPREFFEALSGALDGTYVYATKPHEDAECPLEHKSAHKAATASLPRRRVSGASSEPTLRAWLLAEA